MKEVTEEQIAQEKQKMNYCASIELTVATDKEPTQNS